ncbi:hypothetical protein [Cytobacillus firmus]|nr:hypothetical protein [Cytobacillus firmus]
MTKNQMRVGKWQLMIRNNAEKPELKRRNDSKYSSYRKRGR